MCGAYLVIGGKAVWQAFTAGSPIPLTPRTAFYSSDAYLQSLVGVENGSERLLKTFASLPSSKPIYVFLPQDEVYSSFVSAIVVYLGWPAQFHWIEVRQDNAFRELSAVDPASCSAIVFCRVKPPNWLQPKIAFAYGFSIVPMEQKTARR